MKKCPLNKIFCWILWEAKRESSSYKHNSVLYADFFLILQHLLYVYIQNHSALSPGSLDIIKMLSWLQFWVYLCPGLLHSCPFKVLLWPVVVPLGPSPKSLWWVNTIFPLRRMSLCQQRCWRNHLLGPGHLCFRKVLEGCWIAEPPSPSILVESSLPA